MTHDLSTHSHARSPARSPRLLPLAAASALLLCACGGGGGDDKGGGSVAFSIDPASVNPTSTTTDQPFLDPNVVEFYAFGSSCRSTAKGQAVLVTDNTVTYSDGTPSAAHLKRVSQYAEAAVRTLRDKFGITAPGNVGFDGQKLRVCAVISGSDNQTNGSAGVRTLHIGTPEGYSRLATLIYHESTHAVQAQALNCQIQQYGWERWFTEGMALHVAGQDAPSSGDLAGLQSTFAGIEGNLPMGDMDQRAGVRNDRYPAYRLAVDTLLGETGKTDQDLYRFLVQVGRTTGCPGEGANYTPAALAAGWKTSFDASFGTDLRGRGAMGADFWTAARKYAK